MTSPPNSQYIQSPFRVPIGVDLPTYLLPLPLLPPYEHCRGRGVRDVVCYLSEDYLWREDSVKRVLCVQ